VTGPVFFAWLCQLLLPIMLVAIVYEKQYGLRIMMKMHGLGEAAYFSVQYLWFLALYCAYIVSFRPLSDASTGDRRTRLCSLQVHGGCRDGEFVGNTCLSHAV
jgi:hypothetical protein